MIDMGEISEGTEAFLTAFFATLFTRKVRIMYVCTYVCMYSFAQDLKCMYVCMHVCIYVNLWLMCTVSILYVYACIHLQLSQAFKFMYTFALR